MSENNNQNCENEGGDSRQVEQIVRRQRLIPKHLIVRNFLFYTGKKQFKDFAARIGFIKGKEYKRKWWRIYLAA